jgi:hypothetical protein
MHKPLRFLRELCACGGELTFLHAQVEIETSSIVAVEMTFISSRYL